MARTCTWDGGDVGALASVAANWDTDTAPVAGDSIVFPTTTKACTWDLNISLVTLTINSGYVNTITQNSGANMTFTGAVAINGACTVTCNSGATFSCTTFNMAAGTFNQGGAFTSTTFTIAAATYVGSSATMSTTAVVLNNSSGNITATSGTWTLAGSFTQTNSPTFSANSGTIAVTATSTMNAPSCTFNLVTVNIASGQFVVSSGTTIPFGSNPSTVVPTGSGANSLICSGTITMSGTWTITGGFNLAAATTVISGALTTISCTESTISILSTATIPSGMDINYTQSSTTSRSFSGGGKTFGTFRRITSGGSGSGSLQIDGSNTFSTFRDDDATLAHTLTFTAGTTQTITTFTVAGSSGKLVTLRSATTNSAWTMTTAAGAKTADYVLIQDSTVDASPTWTAGSHSADGGGNTNWLGFAGGSSSGGGSAVQVRGGAKSGIGGRRFP